MADLVLNEWIWSDLSGENGPRNQSESYGILLAVLQRGDRLVVVEGSAFADKCWRLSRTASDLVQRDALRIFKSILADPAKCLRLPPTTLTDSSRELVTYFKPDDYYLVQAQQAAAGSTIVTTDNDLIAALQQHGLPCRHRDQWVQDYLEAAGIRVG